MRGLSQGVERERTASVRKAQGIERGEKPTAPADFSPKKKMG